MDPILQTLLSWQFILFALAIAAIMFVVRKVVEYAMSNWAISVNESKLWRDLLLPILPVVVGGCGALVFSAFPYPEGLTSHGSRFLFGLVAGLLSTLLYRVINSLLGQKIVTVVQTVSGRNRRVVDTTVVESNTTENCDHIPNDQIPPKGQL